MKQLVAVILILLILLAFVVAFLLTDVDRTAMALYNMLGPLSSSEAPAAEEETEPPPAAAEPGPSSAEEAPSEDTAPPEDDSPADMAEEISADKYIYQQLGETQQALYRQIRGAIAAHDAELLLSEDEQQAFTSNEILEVFNFVLDDNPELFWADSNFVINERTTGSVTVPTKMSFRYLFDGDEQADIQRQIDDYEQRCMVGLSPDAALFDKILHVYEYVIDHTEYDLNSEYNQNIISVALYGKSVCSGYARMTQYLLNRLGIPCTTVNGYAGEPHSWNLVNADGDYYYLDTTWGDPQKLGPNSSGPSESFISYEYFMITDTELAFTHKIDHAYPYPVCDSTALNYYTYTHRLFDEYDYDAVAAVMQSDFLAGKNNISTIRFSNGDAYQTAQERLIDGQDAPKIMADLEAFLANNSSYSYYTDDDFRILNFIL